MAFLVVFVLLSNAVFQLALSFPAAVGFHSRCWCNWLCFFREQEPPLRCGGRAEVDQDQQLLFCGYSSGSNQAFHSSAVGKTGTIYWVYAGNCPVHLPGINCTEKYSRAVIKQGQRWGC